MIFQIASLAAGLLVVSDSPPVVAPSIAVFHQACLSSIPPTRADLAAVAERQGWTAVRTDTPDDLEWRAVYGVGGAQVRLDQHKASDTSNGELICVVSVGSAPANWKDQVSNLQVKASNVGAPGTYDANFYQLPPELELTVWDLPGGSRIHALREPNNNLELSVNYPTGR